MTGDATYLPNRSVPEHDPEPAIIRIQDSGSVVDVLRSQTARSILTQLTEDPKPVSDVAEAVGTSIQNTAYHVNNLQDPELVEVVETWYSAKGREIDVYASSCDPLVLILGDRRDRRRQPDEGESARPRDLRPVSEQSDPVSDV